MPPAQTLRLVAITLLLTAGFPLLPVPDLLLPVIAQTVSDRKAEGDRLLQQGIYQIESRQPKDALQPLEQALQIYRAIKDRHGEGNALANLGKAYFAFQSYAKAIEHSEQSLAIARAIKDQKFEVAVLKRLGLAYSRSENHSEAISSVEQTIAIYRKNNNRVEEIRSLGDLGFVYFGAGNYVKAIESQKKGIALAEKLKDDSVIFEARGNLEETYSVLRGNAFALWQQGLEREQGNQFKAAIQSWEKALQIVRILQDQSTLLLKVENLLEKLGNAYYNLGNYAKAKEYQENRLAIVREPARASGDTALEGRAGGNLAYTDLALSNYSRGIAQLEQRLAIARTNKDFLEEASALNNLGHFYSGLGSHARAIEYHEKSLAIVRKFSNRMTEAGVLSYLGNAYYDLGDYSKAISYYKQGLPTSQGPKLRGAHQLHGAMLGYLGHAYYRLGNYTTALDYYEKSLAIARSINDPQKEASRLGNLGNVYSALRNQAKAVEYREQGLAIFRTIKDRAGEGGSLSGLGSIYEDFGNYPKAIEYYQKSLAVQQETQSREGERVSLADIGSVLEKQNQVDLAIIFYKQSVNVSESIRQDTRKLDRNLQAFYTESVATTYRHLADLLLKQNRVMEAMQVLDLLKVQELQEYLKDVKGNPLTAQGLPLLPQEREIMQAFKQNPAIAQTASSPTVAALMGQLQKTAAAQNLTLPVYKDLQARIQKLGKNIALFYPLILDDRLELVLFIPDRPPIRKTVNVKRTEFEREIAAFRQALPERTRLLKIRQSGQQLYTWLVQPIDAELKAAKVQTIVYAPDGQMRYVPLAALYDGTQWLTQRYQINYLTALALTPIDALHVRSPKAFVGVLTQGRKITVAGKVYEFGPLNYTQAEVAQVTKTIPNTKALIDQPFNRKNLLAQMPQATVVHLATHAKFGGTPEESFIVLGDGDAVTLREVEAWKLPNVSLFVLSACQTALGEKLGNGLEILGFGYQMQRTGSRAAIASLWNVQDDSTAVLMDAFYAGLRKGLPKTEALRQAQIALINSGNYNRPIYWAPFILIGNGL
jgi:CHAT domain-containing protein